MNLNQTTPKEQLIPGCIYRLYHKGKRHANAVFSHIGSTGMPIFHPIGESSFQDIFGLENYDTNWVVIYDMSQTSGG